MNLSPLTMAGMNANKYLGEFVPRAEKPKAKEIVMYKCPTCDELHEWESDAEECCDVPPSDAFPAHCPVCAQKHTDVDSAAECCLWKDIEFGARYLIARAAESGKTWVDAISEVAA